MPPPAFRFAPSPNGELHLGHAYSALFTAEAARETQGRFLLRIEDIDAARCPERFVRQCLDDLAWLGLAWEEPVRRQSEHMADYRAALARLDGMGLLYPCVCSRQDIARAAGATGPRDPEGASLYPGTCKHLPANARDRLRRGPHALRLDMERAMTLAPPLHFDESGEGPEDETGRLAVDPSPWGDVVLARKDIGVSYHIAVVTDDALQGITHVTRGQDLFHATHIHRLLQALLGLPAPLYRHHPLIRDLGGRKLSKSERAPSLGSLREAGVTPEEIRERLGFPISSSP